MNTLSFEQFKSQALSLGFDEVLERQWAPGLALADHTHPFAVKALMVSGDLWLTVGDHTRHLRCGDTFEIERDAVHAERYGSEGATFWAARRHAAQNDAGPTDGAKGA